MLLALSDVSVVASLLDSSSNSLLNLLFLSLLNSNLVLLVLNLLWYRSLIESYWLHGSNLHGNLVCSLYSLNIGLNHCSKSVLVHVVVDLNVFSLEVVVAVDFHLFARDT